MVVERVTAFQNVFMTGSAGSGKSEVIKYIKKLLGSKVVHATRRQESKQARRTSLLARDAYGEHRALDDPRGREAKKRCCYLLGDLGWNVVALFGKSLAVHTQSHNSAVGTDRNKRRTKLVLLVVLCQMRSKH